MNGVLFVKFLAFNPFEYCIVFIDNGMKYAVHGFEQLDSEESCFEVIDRLSKEIDKDLIYRQKLCRLPKPLRKFALNFIDEGLRRRLECYPDIMDVEPFSDKDYTYSNIVDLYNRVHTFARIPRPFLK